MKRTYIAAAALLLGTSAFALAPSDKDAPMSGDTAWEDQDAAAGNPDLDLAVDPDAAVETAVAEPLDPDPEAADHGMTDASAAGVGGPIETADAAATATAAADLAPRPATQNYPPCAPGPGDDSCIQLYEPGVRVALASWSQPTGGLADGTTATAMGGPYEPVADSADLAMNGDGDVDAAAGETGETELAGAEQFTGAGN